MARFDTIVVGAGSAGCVVAGRLSEDAGRRVLLLEAGGDDRSMLLRVPGFVSILHIVPQIKKTLDWGYRLEPQAHALDRTPTYPRGKVVGGGSAINGMLWVRGNRADYDGWAAGGCDGWAWDDVAPFFERGEDFEEDAPGRGSGGPIKVTRAREPSPASSAFYETLAANGVGANLDYNGPRQGGVSWVQMSARDGVRYSASEGYLVPARARPNLVLAQRAFVHRLLFEGDRVTGVMWSDSAGEHVDHADTVVLSAGAIGSPRILMSSGVGPADELRALGLPVVADAPVGRNLQDHLFFPLTFLAPRAGHRGTPLHFLGGMVQHALGRDGWFARTVFEAIAFLRLAAGDGPPDLQLHTLPWAYPAPNQDSGDRPSVDLRPAFTIQPTLLQPRSRGSVRLRSADPAAPPHIDPRFLSEPEDVEVLRAGIAWVRDVARQGALATELGAEIEPGPTATGDALTRAIQHRAATVYHPVGTCAMGSGPGAVVDPHLRVRGVAGLYVADASVFPTLTRGNTNAPTLMVGERCADFVRAAGA